MTIEELLNWHQKEAEKWSLVLQREPETFPRPPSVTKEYLGYVRFHEGAVECLKGVQGEQQ